ncbi:MAG: SAM-dependent methyltransferase, partial [Acidimicrobiales bacterium]
SWSEPNFMNALDASRLPEERSVIVDSFYQRYQDHVAADPAGHAMDYVHIYLTCRKEDLA